MRNKILLLFILLISCALNAQVNWPFEDEDEQATVVGTIGEIRGSSNSPRIHKGVDLTNGTDINIYAINDGIVTWNNSGGNWNHSLSYIQVGQVKYIHCQPKESILNAGQGVIDVDAGDFIGTMITTGSIHVHLQEDNTNYLNGNLSPYNDNHAPELITNRFGNGYKLYRNGVIRTTQNISNFELTSEVTHNINNQDVDFKILYSKIDIAVDVEDRRTNNVGGNGGGRTAPFGYEYELREFENPNSNDPLYESNLTFNQVPNNNAANFVFHPQSLSPGTISTHFLTSHPSETPFFRHFNTRIKENTVETWDLANSNLDATKIEEAQYPDNKYRLYIDAYDVDFNDNPNNRLANRIDVPVIIDNFLPYIQEVTIYDGVSSSTLYHGEWIYQNDVLNFVVSESNYFYDGNPILIEAYASEPLKELKITISDQEYTLEPISDNDDVGHLGFVLDIATPSYPQGQNTLRFDGKDLADNDLLTNPTTLPVKLANGQWPQGTTIGTDTWHQIDVISSDGDFFGADFMIGGSCSGNNRNSSYCLQVCFQDVSTPGNNIASWFWEFGDPNNSTSILKNPAFTYSSPGTYEVTLTVTSTNNETSTISKTITVDDCDSNIQAQIIADVVSGTAPLVVNFSDISIGDIEHREWTFNADTGASNLTGWDFISGDYNSPQAEVVFQYAGSWPVYLTLEDEFGNEVVSNTIVINVETSSPTDLFVDFSTEGLVYTGSIIQFESHIGQGCNELQYQWTFNDYNGAHYSNLPNPTYVFPVPGNYAVELCVSDNCGNYTCVTKNLNISNYTSNVFAKMSSPIQHQNWVVQKGQPIEFWDISQPIGNIDHGAWFFDYYEGISGPDLFYYYPRPNPIVHTYNEVGTYRVRLYVGENAAYYGSHVEHTITVVDEYDYLEIPTLHESNSQTFANKNFKYIQTKDFSGNMLVGAYNYASNNNQFLKSSIEVYEKNPSNLYGAPITIYELNSDSPQFGLYPNQYVSGHDNKIAVLEKNGSNSEVIPLRQVKIFKKEGSSWSSNSLLQNIDYYIEDDLNYTRPWAVKLYNNTLLISEFSRNRVPYESNGITLHYNRKSYQVGVFEINEQTGLFERTATLLSGNPYTQAYFGQEDSFGNDLAMNDNTILVGESDSPSFISDDHLYFKTDIGWVNSIESALLNSGSTSNYQELGNSSIINNNIIGTTISNLGTVIFEKPENNWLPNNIPNYYFKFFWQNIEDYNNWPAAPGYSELQTIGDNGNFIITEGRQVRDFMHPTYTDKWRVINVFYKEGNSWQSKDMEDLRLYPINGVTEDMSNGPVDEYNNEITQVFNEHSNTGSKNTTLYFYDLSGSGSNSGSSGAGVCHEDALLQNLNISSFNQGAEGSNITIQSSNFNSGASVTYMATNSIKISPNTSIKEGANFKASIVDCNLIDQ